MNHLAALAEAEKLLGTSMDWIVDNWQLAMSVLALEAKDSALAEQVVTSLDSSRSRMEWFTG